MNYEKLIVNDIDFVVFVCYSVMDVSVYGQYSIRFRSYYYKYTNMWKHNRLNETELYSFFLFVQESSFFIGNWFFTSLLDAAYVHLYKGLHIMDCML